MPVTHNTRTVVFPVRQVLKVTSHPSWIGDSPPTPEDGDFAVWHPKPREKPKETCSRKRKGEPTYIVLTGSPKCFSSSFCPWHFVPTAARAIEPSLQSLPSCFAHQPDVRHLVAIYLLQNGSRYGMIVWHQDIEDKNCASIELH